MVTMAAGECINTEDGNGDTDNRNNKEKWMNDFSNMSSMELSNELRKRGLYQGGNIQPKLKNLQNWLEGKPMKTGQPRKQKFDNHALQLSRINCRKEFRCQHLHVGPKNRRVTIPLFFPRHDNMPIYHTIQHVHDPSKQYDTCSIWRRQASSQFLV